MADEPCFGVVKFITDTPRGYWGYIRPDAGGKDIYFCSAAVEGERAERFGRVAYIKHRAPPKPPKTNWSAYKVWRIGS